MILFTLALAIRLFFRTFLLISRYLYSNLVGSRASVSSAMIKGVVSASLMISNSEAITSISPEGNSGLGFFLSTTVPVTEITYSFLRVFAKSMFLLSLSKTI
jgi:hypothetical protein